MNFIYKCRLKSLLTDQDTLMKYEQMGVYFSTDFSLLSAHFFYRCFSAWIPFIKMSLTANMTSSNELFSLPHLSMWSFWNFRILLFWYPPKLFIVSLSICSFWRIIKCLSFIPNVIPKFAHSFFYWFGFCV